MSENMMTPSGLKARHGCTRGAGVRGGVQIRRALSAAHLQRQLDSNLRRLGPHAERVLIRVPGQACSCARQGPPWGAVLAAYPARGALARTL
jgi:hypothetical protein